MDMTAVAIVAILCWAVVSVFSDRKDKKKGQSKQETQIRGEYDEKIAQLNDRITVLERIVTDEKYSLNRQFDELK